MRAVITGGGVLGQEMARALANATNEVTLVEADDELVARLREHTKAQIVHGDACDPAILEQAGTLKADIVVAVTGDDEDNLVTALLAKRYFDVPKVVARVNNPENEWLFTDAWGVDVAVSSSSTLLSLIQEATGSAETVNLLRLDNAGVNLIETSLNDLSLAVGMKLAEVHLPPGTVVATVVRNGEPHVPDGNFVFAAGDEILLVSETATSTEVESAFQRPPR